jgi:hypothetical protein
MYNFDCSFERRNLDRVVIIDQFEHETYPRMDATSEGITIGYISQLKHLGILTESKYMKISDTSNMNFLKLTLLLSNSTFKRQLTLKGSKLHEKMILEVKHLVDNRKWRRGG